MLLRDHVRFLSNVIMVLLFILSRSSGNTVFTQQMFNEFRTKGPVRHGQTRYDMAYEMGSSHFSNRIFQIYKPFENLRFACRFQETKTGKSLFQKPETGVTMHVVFFDGVKYTHVNLTNVDERNTETKKYHMKTDLWASQYTIFFEMGLQETRFDSSIYIYCDLYNDVGVITSNVVQLNCYYGTYQENVAEVVVDVTMARDFYLPCFIMNSTILPKPLLSLPFSWTFCTANGADCKIFESLELNDNKWPVTINESTGELRWLYLTQTAADLLKKRPRLRCFLDGNPITRYHVRVVDTSDNTVDMDTKVVETSTPIQQRINIFAYSFGIYNKTFFLPLPKLSMMESEVESISWNHNGIRLKNEEESISNGSCFHPKYSMMARCKGPFKSPYDVEMTIRKGQGRKSQQIIKYSIIPKDHEFIDGMTSKTPDLVIAVGGTHVAFNCTFKGSSGTPEVFKNGIRDYHQWTKKKVESRTKGGKKSKTLMDASLKGSGVNITVNLTNSGSSSFVKFSNITSNCYFICAKYLFSQFKYITSVYHQVIVKIVPIPEVEVELTKNVDNSVTFKSVHMNQTKYLEDNKIALFCVWYFGLLDFGHKCMLRRQITLTEFDTQRLKGPLILNLIYYGSDAVYGKIMQNAVYEMTTQLEDITLKDEKTKVTLKWKPKPEVVYPKHATTTTTQRSTTESTSKPSSPSEGTTSTKASTSTTSSSTSETTTGGKTTHISSVKTVSSPSYEDEKCHVQLKKMKSRKRQGQ